MKFLDRFNNFILNNRIFLLTVIFIIIIILSGNYIFCKYSSVYIQQFYQNEDLKLQESDLDLYQSPQEQYRNSIQHRFFILFNFPLFSILVLFITYKLTKNELKTETFLFYAFLTILISTIRTYSIIPHYNLFDNVLEGTATSPEQYRLVIPSLTYLAKFVFFGLNWTITSRLVNFLFIVICIFLFHIYLRKWFKEKMCVVVVMIFLFMMPLTFLWDYPSDFSEITLFIIGFILIRDQNEKMLYPLIFLASLHRETSIFLIVAYFVSNIKNDNFIKISLKSASYLGVWLIPQVGLRLLFGIKPFRGGTLGWGFFHYNITHIINIRIFYLFLMFSPFILLLLLYRKKISDNFLKRNLITIAFFFLVSLFTTRIEEIRKFTPFLPIIIPLGIMGLRKINKNH